MRRLSRSDVTADTTPLVNPAAAAAAGGGVGGSLTSPGAAGSNASFDANMVIILAALLCVLICALGLNSVIRCVLHCGRRLAPSAAARTGTVTTSVHAQQAGLKKKALRRIPVEVYGGASALPATATECAICLGEFADGEKVRVLPRCHHGFHVRCIDMWLATHTSCPNCRASLAEDGAAIAAAAATGGR
jgi:E3 ubiquitin-protein ligase ATL10/75/76/77/78